MPFISSFWSSDKGNPAPIQKIKRENTQIWHHFTPSNDFPFHLTCLFVVSIIPWTKKSTNQIKAVVYSTRYAEINHSVDDP